MTAGLGLGTAQFGMPYGIANTTGTCPPAEVAAILALAARSGVAVLDTASHYGRAESVLGECLAPGHGFRLVTKLPGDSPAEAIAPAVDAALARLRQPALHGLLLTQAGALSGPDGAARWRAMERLRESGRVAKIGLSIRDRGEFDGLPGFVRPRLVQLPVNILDQRLIADGTLTRLAERGVEIHARSAFLQGLLLMAPADIPAALAAARPAVARFQAAAAAAGLAPLAAALAFVRARPEIGTVLVGVTGLAEFTEILAAARADPVAPEAAGLAFDQPAVLDPWRWPQTLIHHG